MSAQINNIRPEFDREIVDIVDYVMNYEISSVGSISTIPGWRRSGGILPTTSAAFWQRQTGFRATRSPAAKRR